MSLSRKYIENLIDEEISENVAYQNYPKDILVNLAHQVYFAQITQSDKNEQKKTIMDKIEHFQALIIDSGTL